MLSRESLRRFVVEGINNKSICHQGDDGDEDVNLGTTQLTILLRDIMLVLLVVLAGACMRKLDVVKGDCRDEKKLNRFFPFEPKDHLIPREKKNSK